MLSLYFCPINITTRISCQKEAAAEVFLSNQVWIVRWCVCTHALRYLVSGFSLSATRLAGKGLTTGRRRLEDARGVTDLPPRFYVTAVTRQLNYRARLQNAFNVLFLQHILYFVLLRHLFVSCLISAFLLVYSKLACLLCSRLPGRYVGIWFAFGFVGDCFGFLSLNKSVTRLCI